MATIQIRNIPEDVHRRYRTRAAAAGMSLQEYLLEELVRNSRQRTPAEIIAEVEEEMRTTGTEGFARGSATDIIRADRESH
jgi:plasmid stability protein